MKREGMLKRIIWILGAILILLSLVVLSSSTQLKKFSTPKFIDAYTQVSNGENATATPYVTFDACFEQSGVKYRGIHAELNNTVNLAINLNVQTNGTLKNGKITFDDDRNYTLINNINTDDYIKSVTSSSITFSDIPLGVNKTINATLKQTPCNINNFDYELNNLSKTNKLTFTGTHVASDGTETKISKDVYFHIDWYGDIQVIRYSDDYTQNKFILSEEEGKIYIVYTSYVYTNDVTNLKASALDKAAIFETVIPQMQGYNPIDVYVEDIGEINRTLTYDYNPTTRVLTSRMEAVIGEDGLGDIVIYGNSYRQNIVIVYPKEAYTASATGTLLNADSKVYAEGYSTDSNGNLITVTSEPLENKLQVYLSNPQGEVYKFQSKFTDACLTKTNMRVNYKENKDIRNGYIVDWHFNLALLKNFESVIFEEDYSNSPDAQTSSYIEDTDHFVSTAGTNYDLDGITYYDAIRVLPTTFNILGEDGYVKVFNAETNQLVKQLTAVDAGEIIAYDTDVEHIRIETSAPITTGTISIENYKVLDNQKMMAAYNLATFETFETLKSSMKGSVKYADREDVTVVNGDIASTEYLEGSSLFEASLASNAFYPQKLNTNTVNINFRLPSEDFRDRDFVVWESPTIIVEFPEEFERIIYNSFSIEELDEVTITSVNIEEINGKQVLKICTDGLITENDSFKLNYQAEIDEFTTATQGNIRVFASNKITAATRWYFSTTTDEIDIYDVDGDGDITEEVPVENNTSYYAQVNQLVTTTQITNFDNKGTIVEGPNVAKVDKNVTDSARINILVSNGYTDIISNIKIVGRIPFENNKYVINEKNIGSQYSTTLKNTGIRSADGLTNYTVYYSENETATKDLTNSANGWTTNPSDWSNIKSYMIDFGTATLPGKTSYKFYYDVNVPSGLEYGKVTYGTHAIYFDSAIATGLSTETDKVGLMFAAEKQYKLQVNSYKYNTNELICSSSDDKYYSYAWIYIKGEGKGDYTTGFSSSYYSANISELNPGVVYTIKQKSLTGHYLKSDEEISFIVNPVDGNLQLEILSGNPRGTAVFEDNTAKIDFENVFKYNVEIRNKYKGTNNLIKNSTFKLNGPKNNNWVDANGNSTDGSAKSSTGVFTWKKMSVDTVTLEQVDVTDPQILKITDPMNITISLAENNEYVYSDLVNLTPDQIEYINTYTDPPKFSISVYNEYKDATVNVHHYLKDTTTSISESVVINGKINDSYTTTAATDIDTKRYKLVSTSGNTSGIMESETTDVIYYYEEQYHNYTVEYYYDNVIDSTKTETLSAPYGVYVYSYPSKKIDGYELEKADGLPLQISDNETQNKIQVYYVTKGTLPVSVEKTATWVDVKEGIARIDITDIGGSGTEPMDVMLVVDASYSMIFNQYENYGSSSPCLNAAHWTTGTHVNDAGSDAEAVANGCIERFTVVKNVLNTFITDFMSKNSENRMAITSFSWQGKDELTFTNDETAIHSTITNLEAHGLQYNVLGGTYYETGFEKAYAQIQNRNTNESGDSSINSRKTVLVFLTDGSPTNTSSGGTGGWLGGFGQSGNSVSAEEYAELLKNMGVQIYTNGIGINETDDAAACELLRGISSDGTTDFAITDTAEGLAEIYDNISNDIYFAGENARIVDTINSNWIYYEDDTHKPNPSENMTVNGQVVTWNQGTIAGESTFSFFIRLRDNEAQQYADGTWDTNNSLVLTYTDPLGATKSIESENPNLTRKQVTINFYKEGTTEKIKESVYNKGHVIGDMVSHYIAPAMGVNTGYTLVSERSQSIIVSEGINEINYYYAPRTDLSYTVEYYINGTKDDTLTETVTGQTYESTISSHSFKTIPGYRLARTENYPLTIGLSDNVIKAYYEVDTDQRKDIVYVIWFYKDGNYIVEDSISGRANVQYLEHFGEVNKEGIDIVNKYTGYKPVKVEVEGDYILNGEEHRFDDITHISEIDVLPDAVANTSIITVFYEKDDNQRKDLNYTIEYYKDGALADTEPQKANIQVLEDSITIPAGTINTTDKYEGYVFDSETTGTVPTIAKDGDVIKIYYKARTDLTYRVEYIFNNNTDSNLTDTFTATYGEVINTFVDKIKPGYKFSSATVPITIGLGENIIEVNYVTDPEQKKSVNYKIEYYKDEVHVDADDRVIYEYVQYLDTDDIFVDPDEINRSNKYIGYSYVKTIIEPEVPDSYPMFDEELPDVVPSGSIIKVYYASNLYEYRVGYYYDGIIDDSKTERYTARYGTSIGTYVDKVIDGYVFQKTGPLPITITENEEDNFIEVFYVKRTDLSYNVKYLEQGTNAELAPEKVVANQRFGDTITENALDIDGYVKTSESESIEITTGTNEIIFYYTKRNDLSYKVEYYLNGTKDDSLTEEITGQIYGSTISTHTFKTIEGYKLENIENYPITIGTSDNIIKAYYVIDDSQTKELQYTVEYYLNNVQVTADTHTETQIVHILDDEYIDVDENIVNIRDKYYGYKFSHLYVYFGVPVTRAPEPNPTLLTELPLEVSTGSCLRIYYVTDETVTKDVSYTLEYYKDNVLVAEDTEIFTQKVPYVQNYNWITIQKDAINITDKYDGYKYVNLYVSGPNGPEIDGEEKPVIPDSILEGEKIKVYYEKDNFEYSIEYYYDGVKDDSKTEKGTAVFESKINTYSDKVMPGYKLEKVEGNPITITSNQDKNVMKVYYVTDDSQKKTLSYKVEYYKEGDLAAEETFNEEVQLLKEDVLTVNKAAINTTNKFTGYRFVSTEPETIPDRIANGSTIKVNYERDDFEYRVEYFYDGVRDDSKTDTFTVKYGYVVNSYQDKNIDGYVLNVTSPFPFDVTENEERNVLEVYYEKDKFDYTIEYYYDGIRDDSKTETGTEVFQKEINTYPDKVVDGYVLEKVEGNPITITSNRDNNVMKVFYIKRSDLAYTVKYLEQGTNAEIAPNKVVTNKLFGEKITENAIDIDGYNKVNPTTQEITMTTGTNEIVFYYTKRTDLSYRVEYYYNDSINNDYTETITATYLDVIENYTDKVKTGYKFDRVEGIPLTISTNTENNVIRVYYVTDETQTKTLRYQVRYYKDNIEIEEDSFSVTEDVQWLQSDIMTVRKDGINIVNKYDGYKFEKILLQERVKATPTTELTELPDTVESVAIIEVYYIKDSFEYSIEYYYDAAKDESKTEVGTAIFESKIDTYQDKIIDGYVLEKVEGNPITITSNRDNNVMKIFYIKRNDLAYTVKYLEQGTNQELAPEKVVTNQTFQDIITENAIDIDGYNKVNRQENITITTGTNEIIFYYTKRTDLNYRVEYYFDEEIDNSLTETITATYLDVIENYTDKVKPGYKYESDTAPITIGTGENVIRVYYVIDDSQTKELSYTVEYYKDGDKVDEEVEKTTVQLLAPDTMPVDKTKINLVDKYVGYKLDAATETIPDTVTSGQIIKVYYIIDDGNTKDLKYTVEYYKDGEKQVGDTQEVGATVQILKPDTLTVQKDKINTTDKYNGYKFVGTEPNPIPDTIENNGVIKVYYEKDQFEYKVEYYYDANIDNSKTEIFEATYQDVISTYTDKVIDGYKLDEVVGLPLTIDYVEENNVIKVYYEKDIFSYSIEYYYNGEKDDVATEYYSATFGDEITEYTNKVKPGYKFSNTENNPMIITSNETLNVMKVYYEIDDAQRKDISYKVEYYKDGTKADENTVTENVQLLAQEILTVKKDEINVTDKYDGYKFVGTEPEAIPDTVTNGDIIKVNYEKDTFGYTVEYYFEGVRDDAKTESLNALFGEKITTYTDKVEVGYKLDRVDGTPLTITSNPTNNIIKVYYVIDDSQTKELSYKVEYYKDGEKVDEEVETTTVQILDPETMSVAKEKINVTDKYDGYKFVGTEPEVIPDTVTTGTVIKVNYEKDTFGYTVEYYFEGVKDDAKTESLNALFGEKITTYTDKVEVGYKLDRVDGTPLTITSNPANNIIKVYYVIDSTQTKDISYKVEYYKNGTKADEDIKTETVQVLAEEILTVDKTAINTTDKYFGYKFVNTNPETIPDTIVNGGVIKVYYELDSENVKELKYTVEYYKDGVVADSEEFTEVVQVLAGDELTVDKAAINTTDKYYGYKFVSTDPAVIPDTIANGEVIRVYYEIDNSQTKELSYKVEYYKDGVKAEEETETTTVQVLSPETMSVTKEKINVTDKYDGYKFVGTEPEVIPDTVTNGDIIRVNYERDTFEYTVEYYFDNVKDDDKTEVKSALFAEVIETYTDKVEVGYKLDRVDGTPLTITSNPTNNIIKVYYVIDNSQTKELSYKVEYYKDGVKVDEEVETTTVQILDPETMSVAKEKINVTDKYDGYKFVGTDPEVIPDTVATGTVIKVNYEKDTFEYTVEYYFDNVKDDDKTEVKSALFAEVINTYTDKVEVGYKFSNTENYPLTITSNNTLNVMKVFYVTDESQTKEISYAVEYYKEGTLADSEKFAERVQILAEDKLIVNKTAINTTDKYFGYKFVNTDPEMIPDTIANGEVIKVFYEIDEAQTKELSYKVEYYKDGVKAEEEVETTTVQVLAPDTMTVVKDEINLTDKYDGYKFVGTNPEEIPDEVTTGTVIKVNYEKDTFEYTVEYYFEGVRDDAKTETLNALFEEVITTYTDKVEVGYKLDKVEGTPLTISSNPANNIIKVYYVIDEAQTKELSYKVEYYKDGVKSDEDVTTKTVQILDVEELTVDKTVINTTDKYFGYKFVNTDPEVIPDIIANGEVIKVYYELDAEHTKELKYTVEYYKDGVKADEDVTTKVVQILEADTLEVDKTVINTNDKYDGYKLVGTDPEVIPDEVTTGTVIKVNYEKDTFEYTVEYYFEGVRDDAKTETLNALFEEVITTYTDKVEVGYKLDRVEGTPLTITSNPANNIIRVYYVIDEAQTKELKYTVEYYKDGELSETEDFKKVVQILESDTLVVDKTTINTTDKYIGYKLENTDPEEIPDMVMNGDVIKVFYVKDSFEYKVEYYYQGVIDDSKTETNTAVYQETINTYTDKVINGYKLEREENLPLVVSENSENNVIRIYYIIDDENTKELSYTVEYYKDGELSETEDFKKVVQILESDTLEVDKAAINTNDKYVGYSFINTDPEEIPDMVISGDVIKVFYERNDYEYTVEYYYAGIKDDSKTETFVAKYGDRIENVTDKPIEGYTLDRADNFPLVVSENAENNVIKIYYIIDNDQTKEIKYTVEYYKDGVLDEESTQVVTKVVQVLQPSVLDVDKTQINLVDKYDGYKLDAENTVEVPNIVNDGEVIKVYYIRKDAKVVVKYYEQNSENALAEEVTITGKVFDEYKAEEKVIEGYTLVSTTENTEGTMTEESIVVIYYYAKEADVVVKYVDKITGEVIEEVVIPSKDGDIVETIAKDIPGYVLVETPEQSDVVVEKEDIEVIYVYVKISAGVVEKHIDIKSGEVLETNTYEGNEGDPYQTSPSEFEGYDLVMEQYPENESGVMTEDVIEVKYYYIRKASLKVEYIDVNTGEVIEENTIIVEGHEGDTYTVEEKELDGYVLIEKPETEEIVLEVKPEVDEDGNVIIDTETNVIYKYAREADVVIEHIDVNTGEKLAEDEYIEGYEGKSYTTESKEIARYEVVEEPTNKEGVMKVEEVVNEETGEVTLNKTTKVVYKYDKQPAKVIVKYINKLTGEVIAEEVVDGRLDLPYETKEKEFEGYRFLNEEYPENATGVFTEETIVVNYYYMKITKVIVYYVDNVTGDIVSEEIIIDGFEGEEYITTPADIPGYILVEDKYPENASGKHEDSEEKVYYYYVRETSVEVTYVDVDTGEELAEKVIIEGAEGDSYTTEEKEIPYYVLVKVDNPDGEMKATVTKDEETGEEIVDTVTNVVYEYRKAVFDLRIEKTIAEVLVNGENKKVGNDKLVKTEIHRKKITESVVKVVYQIKVINDGEISGSAVISDRLPEGMIFNTSDNPGWKEKGELVYRETDILKPGESAVYEIVLYWNGTKDIGTYTNQAEIVSTENVPGYDDKESKDDNSEASIIIVPSTGIELLVDKMLLTEFLNKGILLVYGLLIFLVIRKRKQS